MTPSWEALNRALNRWDAAKWRIWRAAGRTPFETLPDWQYHRIKSALATIGRTGWGASESAADLEWFVPRHLISDAMDKAEIARSLEKRCGVGKEFRRELREMQRQWQRT